MDGSKVCVIKTDSCYPNKDGKFRPSIQYPEYTGKCSFVENKVYDAVREAFFRMGFDNEHFNTPEWNPLGTIIRPGMSVLIKPNMVLDQNQNKDDGEDCLYTNPAVVAPVVDYVLIALKNDGIIVVGDAPVQGCNFDRLVSESGYGEMMSYYLERGVNISLIDFRSVRSQLEHGVVVVKEKKSASDSIIIDLGKDSEFYGDDKVSLSKLRITNYDPHIMQEHHTPFSFLFLYFVLKYSRCHEQLMFFASYSYPIRLSF